MSIFVSFSLINSINSSYYTASEKYFQKQILYLRIEGQKNKPEKIDKHIFLGVNIH